MTAAIEHLEGGGQLSDLPMPTIGAYTSTVDAVLADLEAECIRAAPGQCTNAAAACAVVGANAYAQLVIDESCALAPDGTEPVALAPGQTCHAVASDPATSSADAADAADDPCPGATTTVTTTGLDDTVLAHEVGHHVQNLIGSSRLDVRGETKNQVSVRVELQADCLAGVWGHSARSDRAITDADLAEATQAAHSIGDDALGHGDQAKFTHGSSQQRIRWFRRGFDSGDPRQCDTFAVRRYDDL